MTVARSSVPGARCAHPINRQLPSMSGASASVRAIASSPSTLSTSTRSSRPTWAVAQASAYSWKLAMSSSRRASLTSASTWSGIVAAGVPSSCEYAKAPPRSNCSSRTRSMSSACSSAVSPGKPLMNVVRSVSDGTRSRSLRSRLSVLLAGGRRMRWSTVGERCCSGMSMYLTTLSMPAMASTSSGEKYDG